MQRKSSLVEENIERASMRVAFRGSVVLSLIEESSGFLTRCRVIFKAECRLVWLSVHLDHRARLVSSCETSLDGRQFLKFANTILHTLDNAGGTEFHLQSLKNRIANFFSIH